MARSLGVGVGWLLLYGFDGEGLGCHSEHSGADDEWYFVVVVVCLPVLGDGWVAVVV